MKTTDFMICYGTSLKTTTAVPLDKAFLVIGRSPEADLRLVNAGISPIHARIVVLDGEVSVADLQSQQGTFLRGKRLTPYQLERWQPGESLRLNNVVLKLRHASAGMSGRHTSRLGFFLPSAPTRPIIRST